MDGRVGAGQTAKLLECGLAHFNFIGCAAHAGIHGECGQHRCVKLVSELYTPMSGRRRRPRQISAD
eukprot:scaffold12673_cov124-Isochrysis_galbana.AAC.3